MPQHKKEYKLLNCKLEKTIADELDEFIEKTGLTKTATVQKALRLFIEHYNKTGKI